MQERRDKIRHEVQRQGQLYGLEALKAALTAAGETFEILYRDEAPSWTPSWIPRGYSRIPWKIITPAEETWFKEDVASRNEALASALSRCAESHEPLLFVFEGRGAFFRMTRDVAERNVDAIFADGVSSLSPLWVTSPPKQWLIEVTGEDVRVADTPATAEDGDETFNINGQRAFDALVKALDASETSYVAFNPDDPGSPDLPRIRQDRPIAPLRMTVPTQDHELARDIVLRFIEARSAPDAPIQLILTRTPRIQLARADFMSRFDLVFALADDINLAAPGAEWVIRIRRRSLTWIEGVG